MKADVVDELYRCICSAGVESNDESMPQCYRIHQSLASFSIILKPFKIRSSVQKLFAYVINRSESTCINELSNHRCPSRTARDRGARPRLPVRIVREAARRLERAGRADEAHALEREEPVLDGAVVVQRL